MDTPVPIPNTEVKHFNGEDSVSENNKLPIFFCFKKTKLIKNLVFFMLGVTLGVTIIEIFFKLSTNSSQFISK